MDPAFDLVSLCMGAGATFVARTTAFHAPQMTDIIEKALEHKGFSVVEVMTQCPTYFGRKNKQGGPVDMMKLLKETTTPIGSKAKKENPDLIERGIFIQEERPEYCEAYQELTKKAGGRNV